MAAISFYFFNVHELSLAHVQTLKPFLILVRSKAFQNPFFYSNDQIDVCSSDSNSTPAVIFCPVAFYTRDGRLAALRASCHASSLTAAVLAASERLKTTHPCVQQWLGPSYLENKWDSGAAGTGVIHSGCKRCDADDCS